jgi:hypothetical protein
VKNHQRSNSEPILPKGYAHIRSAIRALLGMESDLATHEGNAKVRDGGSDGVVERRKANVLRAEPEGDTTG